MMMRIDDRQIGFQDLLAQLAQPRLVGVGMKVGAWFAGIHGHGGLLRTPPLPIARTD